MAARRTEACMPHGSRVGRRVGVRGAGCSVCVCGIGDYRAGLLGNLHVVRVFSADDESL